MHAVSVFHVPTFIAEGVFDLRDCSEYTVLWIHLHKSETDLLNCHETSEACVKHRKRSEMRTGVSKTDAATVWYALLHARVTSWKNIFVKFGFGM